MGNKNLKLAVESYNNLIFLKEQPLMILAMISRQFVLILQAKIFSSNGEDYNSIAKKLGGISIDSNKTKSKNVFLFILGAVAGNMK